MRVLFTTQPAASHLDPLLPLARELASRGWEVTVAASEPFGETVRRRGLELVAAGLPWLESEAEQAFPELASMSLDEQGYWWVSDVFADRAARPMAADRLERLVPTPGPRRSTGLRAARRT